MKHIFYFLLIPFLSIAQQSVRVTYESVRLFPNSFLNSLSESQRTSLKESQKKPYVATLTNVGDESLYMSFEKKNDTIAGKDTGSKENVDKGIIMKGQKFWRLKNFKDKTQVGLVNIDNNDYYIKKQIEEPKIYFTNKDLQIGKYLCKYAYSINEKQNDTIKYWYTDEIPIDDGPKNVIGFPGLVLKIETKNSMEYAVKVEFFKEKIIFDKPKNFNKTITQDEYLKLKNEAEKPKTFFNAEGNKNTIETIKQ
jgi:GLPGLI family protein